MIRVIKGSVDLQECRDKLNLKKKETLPRKETRVKKVNLDFRECQELERKVNLESQGPEENLEKMVKKEKKGVQGIPATRGTQDSRAERVLRETKVKQVLQAHLELLSAQDPWEKKASGGSRDCQDREESQAPRVSQDYKANQALQASQSQGSLVLLATLVKEEKKVTKDFQGCLCQDQVEEMDPRALLGPPEPPDDQATQMDLWNASLDQ